MGIEGSREGRCLVFVLVVDLFSRVLFGEGRLLYFYVFCWGIVFERGFEFTIRGSR